MTEINLRYKKIPSFFFLTGPLTAFYGYSGKFKGKESVPPISSEVNGFKINESHLNNFNKLCKINKGDLSVIYPLTLVFPFFQKILSIKEAPLNLFRVLGKSIDIKQFRKIKIDETLDMKCEISDLRIVEKGLEADLSAVIKVEGETVWTAVETFFYKGEFGTPDGGNSDIKYEEISDSKVMIKWFLPGKNKFRFAWISGDGNPLHYLKIYARIFGFKSDFAQPFLILGNSIGYLMNEEESNKITLNVSFKGQFYYEKDVLIVKEAKYEGVNRFDIYSEGNEKPCMRGVLKNWI